MSGLKTSVRRWYRGLPPITAGIVIGLSALYVALLILGLAWPEASEALWSWLSLVPTEAWRRPWTLLTMVPLHKDPLHVLLNVMAFASLAPWVERSIGRRRFPLLLAISALAGSLAYALIGWPLGWATPAFGASGLVLGVMTAFALLYPEAELRFWFAAPLKAKNLIWLIVGIDAILVAAGTRIDVPVHFGAMIAAWAFLRKPWQASYRRRVALWVRRLRGSR
jgi:membrane associated rhomboid family serine protease